MKLPSVSADSTTVRLHLQQPAPGHPTDAAAQLHLRRPSTSGVMPRGVDGTAPLPLSTAGPPREPAPNRMRGFGGISFQEALMNVMRSNPDRDADHVRSLDTVTGVQTSGQCGPGWISVVKGHQSSEFSTDECIHFELLIADDLYAGLRGIPCRDLDASRLGETEYQVAMAYARVAMMKFECRPGSFKLKVGDFYALARQVKEVRGKSLSQLNEAVNKLREGFNLPPCALETYGGLLGTTDTKSLEASKPPEAKTSNEHAHVDGDRERRKSHERCRRITAALKGGLLIQCGHGYGKQFGKYDPIDVRPLSPGEVENTFARLLQGPEAPLEDQCARVFDALSQGVVPVDVALRSIWRLIDENRAGDSNDRMWGTVQPASAILLAIPPAKLARVTLPMPIVLELAQLSRLLLGDMYALGTRGARRHSDITKLTDAGRHDEVEEALLALMGKAVDTHWGKVLSDKFNSALNILFDNARRLETFLDSPAAASPGHDNESIAELLDRFVPRSAEPLRTISFFEATAAEPELGPEPEPRSTPTVKTASLSQPAPAAAPDTAAAGGRRPRAGTSLTARAPQPLQQPQARPGAKRTQPGHNHAQDRQHLKKRDANAFWEKNAAVLQGLIDPYAKWKDVKDQVLAAREAERQERILRNKDLASQDPLLL